MSEPFPDEPTPEGKMARFKEFLDALNEIVIKCPKCDDWPEYYDDEDHPDGPQRVAVWGCMCHSYDCYPEFRDPECCTKEGMVNSDE